jgi:hypothetical protein
MLTLFIIIGFIIYSFNNYRVKENFTPLPLSFDATNSISTYDWNGILIKIQGGFIKGKQIDDTKSENLILRSLSPTPTITITNKSEVNKVCLLRVENVNPIDTKFLNIDTKDIKIIDSHTILLSVNLNKNEVKNIEVQPKDDKKDFEFVMLGDNRDGYSTFSNILDQVNAINPTFVIDDGDLVYGGEPNKYRLFYQSISKLKLPFYTTLGNHDIRENGRVTYTKLFGPPYYSFNYKNAHFVFLDSSRGWAEKRAIPEEQYTWLENDLKNAQGKLIFVISHIPPTDPREYVDPNTIPDIPDEEKPSFLERIMNNYTEYKSLNHGFPDKNEAKRFENLMTKYNVHTVLLSHIHSYFSYIKDNVRYVISGGGGAELLTTNSYYHYLRIKVNDKETYLEAIELPSPKNDIVDRYLGTIQLFAKAIYIEYKAIVITVASIVILILVWILFNTRNSWIKYLVFVGKWLSEIFKVAVIKFKELKKDLK